MKIMLCYPPVSFEYNKIRDAGMTPHLSLLCIASHLNAVFDDLEFVIMDGHIDGLDEIRRRIREFSPDMLGFSVDFTNYSNAVELSRYAKELDPGVWTAVGSNHATNLYREILSCRPEIDYVSMFDGEPSWEDLVRIRRGELDVEDARNLAYRADDGVRMTKNEQMDLEDMVPVDYSLVDLEPYFEKQRESFGPHFRMLQFTSQRGCANTPLCVFCGRYTDGIRFRKPEDYAREIAYWTEKCGLTEVWDRSDSFIQSKKWLREFCEEIEKYTDRFRTGKTTFKTYSRADQLLDPEVLSELKRLNFRMVFIGYEAGDDRILKNIGKHANLDVYRRATRNVLSEGMDIDASFIVGLPGENRESMANHVSFVRELIGMGLDKIRVNRLLVLPGTPLYSAVMSAYPELRGRDIISQEELQRKLFLTDLYDLSDFGGSVEAFEEAVRQTAETMTGSIVESGGGAEGYGYGKDMNILEGKQLQNVKDNMIEKETDFIEMSDGAFICAEHYPNPGKPVIMLIPGFCCTIRSFDRNAPELAKDFEVIVYDPRGQGRSSKGLFGHTVSRNAQDIREVARFYGADKVSVVAWSMAGQFIMDYVRQYGTEGLASVTLADCPLHALGSDEWNAHGLRDGNMPHFLDHLGRSYNHWAEYCEGFARKIWGGIDDSRIEQATEEFTQTPPWIAFAIYSDMVYRNGYPYLSKTDVPMLFTGADSKVTENGIDLASKWYPSARPAELVSEICTFDNGGHVFFDVEHEKFNSVLKDFINSL